MTKKLPIEKRKRVTFQLNVPWSDRIRQPYLKRAINPVQYFSGAQLNRGIDVLWERSCFTSIPVKFFPRSGFGLRSRPQVGRLWMPSAVAVGKRQQVNSSFASKRTGLGNAHLWCREARNVSALPECLDRPRVVVLAYVCHCFTGRHAIEHCDAGQRGSGPSASAATGNFHTL